MILVDTSVWIDYFRGRACPETHYLSATLEDNEDICISGIILTEILQGISREKEYKSVRAMLNPLIFLSLDRAAYEFAAMLYRRAKSKGETIRNTVDCLIAACAVTHDVALLHNDRDFLALAKVSGLRLVHPVDSR